MNNPIIKLWEALRDVVFTFLKSLRPEQSRPHEPATEDNTKCNSNDNNTSQANQTNTSCDTKISNPSSPPLSITPNKDPVPEKKPNSENESANHSKNEDNNNGPSQEEQSNIDDKQKSQNNSIAANEINTFQTNIDIERISGKIARNHNARMKKKQYPKHSNQKNQGQETAEDQMTLECNREARYRICKIYVRTSNRTQFFQSDVALVNNELTDYANEIKDADGNQIMKLPSPMIFMFDKSWIGKGRLKDKISYSNGYYIIIVPCTFDKVNLNNSHTTTTCSDENYKAYLLRGYECYGLFEVAGLFERVAEINGKRVFDANVDSNLYVDRFPELKCQSRFLDTHAIVYYNITKKQLFKLPKTNLVLGSNVQELNPDRLNSGTYLVAVINADSKIIYKQEFRFSVELKKIMFNEKLYSEDYIKQNDLTYNTNSAEFILEFVENKKVKIENKKCRIHNLGGGRYNLTVLNHALETQVVIHDTEGYKITLELAVPSLRWRLDKMRSWIAQPIVMSHDEFFKFKGSIILKVPSCVKYLFMKYKNDRTKYNTKIFEDNPYYATAELNPFKDYYYSRDIRECSETMLIKVEMFNKEIVIMKLLPSIDSNPNHTVRKITHSTAVLKPANIGVRKANKGFSEAEVHKASASILIKICNLKVDSRRSSCHERNVNLLKTALKKVDHE